MSPVTYAAECLQDGKKVQIYSFRELASAMKVYGGHAMRDVPPEQYAAFVKVPPNSRFRLIKTNDTWIYTSRPKDKGKWNFCEDVPGKNYQLCGDIKLGSSDTLYSDGGKVYEISWVDKSLEAYCHQEKGEGNEGKAWIVKDTIFNGYVTQKPSEKIKVMEKRWYFIDIDTISEESF